MSKYVIRNLNGEGYYKGSFTFQGSRYAIFGNFYDEDSKIKIFAKKETADKYLRRGFENCFPYEMKVEKYEEAFK